jgi:hypothetical protein
MNVARIEKISGSGEVRTLYGEAHEDGTALVRDIEGFLGRFIVLPPMLSGLLMWHRNPRSRWILASSFTILLGVAMAMTACGGGSSTTSPLGGGTPAGSYTITVTGTAASGATTLTHSTKLTLAGISHNK